jgi:hypothetical protein
MDHLPEVEDPALPILSIPYYCSSPFDRGSFVEYPIRRGFDEQLLRHQLNSVVSTNEAEWIQVADYIQSWLFMGLANELLLSKASADGGPTAEQLFVVDGKITTKPLQSLFFNKIKHRQNMDLTDPDHLLGPLTMKKTLQQVYGILEDCSGYDYQRFLDEPHTRQSHLPLFIRELLLSVLILHTSVAHCMNEAFGQVFKIEISSSSRLVMERLVQAQWCPRHIFEQATYLDSLTLLYVGQLRHINQGPLHDTCTGQFCKYAAINNSTYQTAHVENCSGCTSISIDDVQYDGYYDDGSFPLLCVEGYTDHDGVLQPNLRIRSSNEQKSFVAISHVWSDGLGNPQANALPACQILRIAITFKHYAKTGQFPNIGPGDRLYFWIDTLCVPANSGLKSKALAVLNQTFEMAAAVVVLDNDLQKASVTRPYVEKIARIRTSRWMTRLWTLSEAVFAPSNALFALFRDGLFRIDHGSEKEAVKQYRSDASKPPDPVVRMIHNVLYVTWDRILDLRSSKDRIDRLGQLIHGRALSQPGDEFIVIGAILGLNAKLINETPVEQRMQKVIELQRFWPVTTLFSPFKHMKVSGFKWAAQSFLDKGMKTELLGGDTSLIQEFRNRNLFNSEKNLMGEQTPWGFKIQLPCFQLHPAMRLPGRIPSKKVHDEAGYAATSSIDKASVRTFLWFYKPMKLWYRIAFLPAKDHFGEDRANSWDMPDPVHYGTPCESSGHHSALLLTESGLSTTYTIGVLVHVYDVYARGTDRSLLQPDNGSCRYSNAFSHLKERKRPGAIGSARDVIYAHHCCNVMVMREPNPDFDLPASVTSEQLEQIKASGLGDGRLFGELDRDAADQFFKTVTEGSGCTAVWYIA